MTHTHSPIPRLILAVLALAGSLTACQRELVVDNPYFDPEKNEVVANLVLNVNTGQNTGTKMSATNVQKNNNFLGIQDAILIPFETGNTSGESYVTLKEGHASGTQMYSLNVLFGPNQVDATQNEGASSTRIVQLTIPVGTDAMLFYGKAVRPNTPIPPANSDVAKSNHSIWQTRGGIVSSIKLTPSETRFNLVSRLTGDKAYIPNDEAAISVDAYNQTARLMELILNYILDSSAAAISSYDGFSGYPITGRESAGLTEITWEKLGNRYSNNEELRPLEQILAVPYAKIMKIETNEYRAASSDAVRRMIEDLYAVVKSVSNATPLDGFEANAKRLAKEVIAERIKKFFVTESDDPDKLFWFKDLSTIQYQLTQAEGALLSEEAYNNSYSKASEPNGFPYYDFHIPEGAAQMGIVSDDSGHKSIIYKIPNRALLHPEETETNVSFPPYQYTYPAELAYYVNSPLLISSATDIDNTTTSFPNGYKNWYNPKAWENLGKGWAQGSVTSSTHGVAVRDNINYGVAMLETSVKYGDITYFNDNRSVVLNNGEADQRIDRSSLNLELYGVLIGGQHPEADWQYLSTSSKPADYKFVLYDDDISDDQSKVPTTNPVYTLVFDNYINAEQQLEVPIALEFINHGDDFWGRDNLVRNGGTFYLLGKLKVSGEDATDNIDWDTISKNTTTRYGYQVPPIYGVGTEAVPEGKTAGKSKQVTRVFIQNFVTKANFSLNENSLKHAYVTVPDLRSTQMSVGLSVDLHWEEGLIFNVDL